MNKSLISLAALTLATGVSAHDSPDFRCVPVVDMCRETADNLHRDSSGHYLTACLFPTGEPLVCPKIPLGDALLATVGHRPFDARWGYGSSFDGGNTRGASYDPVMIGDCADPFEWVGSLGRCWSECKSDADGDGVLDLYDHCLGQGVAGDVDDFGCPLDAAAESPLPDTGPGYRDVVRCGTFSGAGTNNYRWNGLSSEGYGGQHGNISLPDGKDPQPDGHVLTTIRVYNHGSKRVIDYAGACP